MKSSRVPCFFPSSPCLNDSLTARLLNWCVEGILVKQLRGELKASSQDSRPLE